MAVRKNTYKILVPTRPKFKPAKGSVYCFTIGGEYLRLEADYKAVVDIAEEGLSPDYVNRKIFYSEAFRQGTIASIGISVSDTDINTQENTYSLLIDGIDAFYFKEAELETFKEIKTKIELWNVVG